MRNRLAITFLAALLTCGSAIAQGQKGEAPQPKEGEATEGTCSSNFTFNLGTIITAQPNGTFQTVSRDCTGTPGCNDYFDITCNVGSILNMTFCSDGGTGNYDTSLNTWSGPPTYTTLEDCNDDSCGLLSLLDFTFPSTGTFRARVGGFAGGSGIYTLAYRAPAGCTITIVTETEPNDTKAQANLVQLPATTTAAWITGNSTSAAGAGLDYFRVTTAAQTTPGFYRHRLTAQSTLVGHTVTIRGLSQTGGVINTTSDIAVQTSSVATAPPNTIQWYTSQAPADLYVRVTGTAVNTANYTLDYEVTGPVAEIAGPTGLPVGSITITTVAQTTTDTDTWVYDPSRAAIVNYGNDDEPAPGTTLQSLLTRTYAAGLHHLSISDFQWANNLAAAPDDRFQNGNVLDFPGAIANSSTTANAILNPMIGGTSVPATKAGFFDVVFISFGVGAAGTCNETEPNDTKAQATPCTLPPANQTAAITGNSTSATGVGLDYFLVTTAAQSTPGFYRHRLTAQSTTVGHTVTIRGLSQTGGVINTASDIAVQTSSAATAPPRTIQWYTSQAPANLYVRVTGAAATTANYTLDYEVTGPVAEIAGPTGLPVGSITITTVAQTTTDTDTWVYDPSRVAIVNYGNDDEPAPGTTLQSLLTRTYAAGLHHLSISNFQWANNLAAAPDDRFQAGNVLDFPGAIANSSTTTGLILNPMIGGTSVPATKAGFFDVVFISFGVGAGTCNETEPNDTKAQATPCTLPPANQTAAITGNSTSAAGAGLDYFRLTTAVQPTAGFYRHRIIIQSATVGHTGTIRGLSQTGGVINPTSDTAFQTSSAATTPPRFVQWYTSQAPADIYVRITGTAATTADYTLDYEVTPVAEIAGPTNATQGLVITTVGQTTTDTDLWVYDSDRAAVMNFGNDDEPAPGTTPQSLLSRNYMPGQYHLSITDFDHANEMPAAPDDSFQDGGALDFPGNIANSNTTIGLSLNPMIGGTPVAATKAGPFDVVFVSFTVVVPVDLLDFDVE